MDYKDLTQLVKAYPAGYIKFKAKQVVESLGLPSYDFEDFEQELIIHVLEKEPEWDGTKSTWNSFARMVIDQKIAGIIKERTAQKRDYRLVLNSLDDAVEEIGSEYEDKFLEHQFKRTHKTNELAIDMKGFIKDLPRNTKPFAVALQTFNGWETARVLGVSISTVTRYKRILREKMEDAGMKKYLHE